jgi:succinate dehydrogenase / fumarate reductase membrane anchor subunit
VSGHQKTFRNRVKVSERHGAGEWTAERLSALALAPLGLWGAWAGFELAGGGYAGALAWLAQPVNSTLLVLTLLVSFWHMNMGFNVIVEDYIHRPATRDPRRCRPVSEPDLAWRPMNSSITPMTSSWWARAVRACAPRSVPPSRG